MTLTEILQNSDYAEIFSGWLRKRLPNEYSVHYAPSELAKNCIFVAKSLKNDDILSFVIEVMRLGKTFEVRTSYGYQDNKEQFKTIEQVLTHIEDVTSRPEEWADDLRPLDLE